MCSNGLNAYTYQNYSQSAYNWLHALESLYLISSDNASWLIPVIIPSPLFENVTLSDSPSVRDIKFFNKGFQMWNRSYHLKVLRPPQSWLPTQLDTCCSSRPDAIFSRCVGDPLMTLCCFLLFGRIFHLIHSPFSNCIVWVTGLHPSPPVHQLYEF